MGNVTLPTPVFAAGGALCLLGGYLIGAVTGPDTPDRTTATVSSYEPSSNRLCLAGDGVEDQPGVGVDGRLCGTWSRPGASRVPEHGDRFRFVSAPAKDGAARTTSIAIYGDVLE